MEREIDRAVSELSSLSATLGLGRPRRLADPSDMIEGIERVKSAIAPLLFPVDLEHFWTTWDLTSFEILDLVDVILLSPDQSLEFLDMYIGMEWPGILLPLSDTQYSSLSLEMSTPSVEGGRLFDLSSHFESYLVGHGVVDAVQILTAAIALGHDPAGPMESNAYFDFLDRRARQLGSVEVSIDKGQWPANWLEADGFPQDWLQPRGRTHSVAQFEKERSEQSPLRSVLQGTWTMKAGVGGADIGSLEDETGSITLRIPLDIPHAGYGLERRIEVEVESVSRPQTPIPPWAPSGPSDDESEHASIVDAIMASRARSVSYDPVVQVLAVRPIRS